MKEILQQLTNMNINIDSATAVEIARYVCLMIIIEFGGALIITLSVFVTLYFVITRIFLFFKKHDLN